VGQTGKITVAAIIAAVSGFVIGLVFYALRVEIHQNASWDHQANVALAMRAGILSAVLVFFILYRKIRSS
jgi:hypothetical protein